MSKKEIMFEILRERYPEIREDAKFYYYENEHSVTLTVDDRYAAYTLDCSVGLYNRVFILADSYPFADFELSDQIVMNSYENSVNYSPEAEFLLARINAVDEKERG
jgi:hypothetical protein